MNETKEYTSISEILATAKQRDTGSAFILLVAEYQEEPVEELLQVVEKLDVRHVVL